MSQAHNPRQELDHLRTANIDDLRDRQRVALAQTVESILCHRWPIEEVEEIMVTGSWHRGEAIEGISDLDLVVMVDPRKVTGPVEGVREWFKNEWSPDLSPREFMFIDLWVEPGPPADGGVPLIPQEHTRNP